MFERKAFLMVVVLLLFLVCLVYSQNPEWVVYDTSNSGLPSNGVGRIAIDGYGNKWMACAGLTMFDGTNWTVYNTSNSGLPSDDVRYIAIDDSGNKWIGTWGGGLAQFDGNNWTVYNTSNSGLPSDQINCIAIDSSGDKWIGTRFNPDRPGGLALFDGINWTVYDTMYDVLSIAIDDSDNKWIGTYTVTLGPFLWGGLFRFDGTNWTVYNTSNSSLPSDWVLWTAIDNYDNKWIGAMKGFPHGWDFSPLLAKFDGINWTVYDTSNSGLPSDLIRCIAIDDSGNKWIGTGGSGLAKFDGTNWTVYNTSNSGLPYDNVFSITIDDIGNKWIGTAGGLAVFNAGGVISIEPPKEFLIYNYSLQQNYPNPFNPITTIKYNLPKSSQVTLKIFNILGEEVSTLVSKQLPAGTYSYEWDAKHYASGIYLYRLETDGYVQTKKMVVMK